MTGPRELYVIRHAPAEDSSPRGDHGRALTAEGRSEMADAVDGLARLIDPLELIAASPLTRARQTADLLAERFPDAERATLDALAPGLDREALAEWLDAAPQRRIAIVGHEPDLSALVGWLIGGAGGARLKMRKGAVAALALGGGLGPRVAELDWHMTRGALRRLGGGR
jgi:phosphohistidine phosphatase